MDDLPPPPPFGSDRRALAGFLAICLGWLGVHKFFLGYPVEGFTMAAVSIIGGVCTCGMVTMAVWLFGAMEGVVYLSQTDEQFAQTYVAGRRGWM